MWGRFGRTALWTSITLVLLGGALGFAVGEGPSMSAAARGVACGAVIAVVAVVHLLFRTFDARTPESWSPEFQRNSLEREVLRTASARSLPDLVSLMLLAALISLWGADGTVERVAPFVALMGGLGIFAVRLRAEWRHKVTRDA